MSPWRFTLYGIKDLLSEDESEAAARKCADGIIAILTGQDWPSGLSRPGKRIVMAFKHATICAEVNEALSDLYDWADAQDVWIAWPRQMRETQAAPVTGGDE